MLRVNFSYLALRDVDDGVEFYDGQQPGLGESFRFAVEAAAGLISTQPGIGGRVGRRQARRLIVDRFPFSLVYGVRNGVAEVYAVPHHRARASNWFGRLPR